MRRTLALTLIATAMLLAPAASEGAVTIGHNLAQNPDSSLCGPGQECTFVQATLNPSIAAAGGLTSPIDGVVVRWRLKAASAGGTASLRVLAPTSSGVFTAAGTGSPEVVTASQPAVNVYDARLPIAAGHHIGLYNASSGTYFAQSTFAGSIGSNVLYTRDLPDGETRPFASTAHYVLFMNADVEPDADRDGFGDETQDGCRTNALTQGRCPPAPAARQPGLKPGACSNQKRGGAAGETLNGTPAGDTLLGLAGKDILNGLQGDDCLLGGAGAEPTSSAGKRRGGLRV